MHIQIFCCGGTIDKVYFDANSEFEVGEPEIEAIFRDARVTFDFQIESLMRKDSLEMTDADRELVRRCVSACPHDLILITHGTDTMAETARALAGIPSKVIVLTGSMTPARFRVTDAVFNIGCAVGALQSRPPGVYIAINGRVLPGDRAYKNPEKGIFEELLP
jgi:L-asparaginase